MGQSSRQPYLYDPPVRYSVVSSENNFNPKSVEQASRAPKPVKPKHEGPLINFNQHPDSYGYMPANQPKTRPMNVKVKTWVKWARILQLLLRTCQLVGAIGLTVCVIVIRGTQRVDGWILRVPSVVDIFTDLYAVYHLLRSAHRRPPASSASYHFFALLIDSGLVPFYVVTAIMSHNNFLLPSGTEGRWRTSFKNKETTDKVFKATWLLCTTNGGIHVLTLLISLYLLVVFRKIANMPPDMNPLESNLTSRNSKRRGHKYKDSNITVTTDTTFTSEKDHRWSALTGDTAVSASSSPTRSKARGAVDPILPEYRGSTARPVSFFSTRNDSGMQFSPHTPESARLSRADLPSQYQQLQLQYHQQSASQVSLHRHKRNSTMTSVLVKSRSGSVVRTSEHDTIDVDDSDKESIYDERSEYDPYRANSDNGGYRVTSTRDFAITNATPHDNLDSDKENSTQQGRKPSATRQANMKNDNWFVVADDSDVETADLAESHSGVGAYSVGSHNGVPSRPTTASFDFEATTAPSPLRTSALANQQQTVALSPLGMNPPTPPPAASTAATTTPIRNLMRGVAANNSANINAHSTVSSAATPKRKTYGDLSTATADIRGSPRAQNQHQQDGRSTSASSKRRQQRRNGSIERKRAARADITPVTLTTHGSGAGAGDNGNSSRVVSRTGVDFDYADGDLGLGGDAAGARSGWRRREVSGKVVEEGRAGGRGSGLWEDDPERDWRHGVMTRWNN